jgi:hypothetical protein
MEISQTCETMPKIPVNALPSTIYTYHSLLLLGNDSITKKRQPSQTVSPNETNEKITKTSIQHQRTYYIDIANALRDKHTLSVQHLRHLAVGVVQQYIARL